MKRSVLGIDPGLSGALALLNHGRFVAAWPMPIQAKKTSGNEVDCDSFSALAAHIRAEYFLSDNISLDRVVIERTTAAPVLGKRSKGGRGTRMGSGLASAYSMGDSFGCARMFAALLGARLAIVAPVSWKRALNLGRDKNEAVALAHKLYPKSREVITLKKHEGLAEALLIAHYAHHHLP